MIATEHLDYSLCELKYNIVIIIKLLPQAFALNVLKLFIIEKLFIISIVIINVIIIYRVYPYII